MQTLIASGAIPCWRLDCETQYHLPDIGYPIDRAASRGLTSFLIKKMQKTLKAVFSLLYASCAIAAHAAAPSYDAYKSWLVACDNGLTCEAKGFQQGNGGTPDLRVDREAGSGATAEATLSIPGASAFDPSKLRVDGHALALDRSAWKIDRDGDFVTLSTKQPAAIASLISQLRNGARLQVANDENAFIPLDGMVAALLRIDDRQGRVGGVTALIRKGDAPASNVPSAPVVPVVAPWTGAGTLAQSEQRSLVLRTKKAEAALFKKQECDASAEQAQAAEAYRLDPHTALVLIPCGLAAYQGWSLVFVTPFAKDGAPTAVRLNVPVGPSDGSDVSLTEPGFDAKTGALTESAKGRGLADCGMQATWVWDGRQFQLSEATYQDGCGGGQPGDWPTVYRTQASQR